MAKTIRPSRAQSSRAEHTRALRVYSFRPAELRDDPGDLLGQASTVQPVLAEEVRAVEHDSPDLVRRCPSLVECCDDHEDTLRTVAAENTPVLHQPSQIAI